MGPFLLVFLSLVSCLVGAELRPNILMIAVDDLRPQLNCYGQKHVVSPNIDRLAAGGLLFDRAYCMVPTCGASRASLMTSIRPSPGRFITYTSRADEDARGIPTLHAHFKRNGYTTLVNGKILHDPEDSADGWSEAPWVPLEHRSEGPAATQPAAKGPPSDRPPFEISDRSEDELSDGEVARETIADLRRLKKEGKPFFLAAGFYKPHLPFIAPRKYWDLYPEASIRLPSNYHPPQDAPEISIHNSGELRTQYSGIPANGKVPDETALKLIRGYHACVSFTDAMIGRVLDELDRLDLGRNTIVVLWSDHGWNLGEHTLWCKHSCYETSMRVPLLIRAPGYRGGLRTEGLTELIDLYPSLCELAGLPVPSHVQGRSFVPLMRDPATPWKEQAIGRFERGDTIRTDRFRFTEYAGPEGEPIARMLYDHEADPGENRNVSETQTTVSEELASRLRSGKGKDSDLPRTKAE